MDTQPHVLANRRAWAGFAAEYEVWGRADWAAGTPRWGLWSIPEEQLHVLPEVAGLDTVELGCGTGYVSSWLARRGARPVGLDNSPDQLRTARRFQQEFGISFPLVQADAEAVPFAEACFDLAINEYGAAMWCDPYRWIPEAARVLRPGGRLIFLASHPLLTLCVPDADGVPASDRLLHPFFGMHRVEWSTSEEVEFQIGHGEMIRLLHANGFEIEDLVEMQPPEGSTTRYPFVTLEWARQWPGEEIWKARKRA